MELASLIYVMIGGALGSSLRYIVMSFIGRLSSGDFPFATLTVNVAGSFLMGVWIALAASLLPEKSRYMHMFFAVGLLGGFTTFSTFSLDVFYLFERGQYTQIAAYILLSVSLSLSALFVGLWLTKALT